jgi:hypothetical protein
MFVVVATKQLSYTDQWCIVYPSLKHFLLSEPSILGYENIMEALKIPVCFFVVKVIVHLIKHLFLSSLVISMTLHLIG